jgi:hypothetical protein
MVSVSNLCVFKHQQLSWFPWPGRHVLLEVLDDQGRVHDTATIEVRGAGVVGARSANPSTHPIQATVTD